MRPWLLWPILIPAAYLLGSIPFGLVVGLWKGVDPRQAGSGNIGATNVGRLLGRRYFFLIFLLDMLKGLLPMLAAGFFLAGQPADWRHYLLWLAVGCAAIFGHMFSLFLRFKGGKGVATSCGVVLGLYPYFTWVGLLALGLFALIFKITRYISLASMIAAASVPVFYILIGLAAGWPIFADQLPLLACAGLIAALILYRHRTNITRLRAGTEHRFDKKEPAIRS